MTNSEKFQLCLQAAKEIVAAYREKAPQGCDPQNTWAVVAVGVGTAVSAGSTMYASNQQGKAAEKQAQALKDGTKEYEPTMLGDPKKIDTRKVNLKTIDDIYDYIPYARRLTDNVNSYNYSRAVQYYRKIQPYFDKLQKQVGSNALSYAKGEIPSDVSDEITREAAEKGIQAGYGFGSQGGKSGALANLNLRNLGLTSLDLSKFGSELGMRVNAQAKSLTPQLMSPMELFLGPAQQLQAESANVGADNSFMIRNNEITNDAAKLNTGLANSLNQASAAGEYNSSVANAQMIAQLGNTLGGAISGLGSGAVGSRSGSMDAGTISAADDIMRRTNAGAVAQPWQTNAYGLS